ncbi:hypothetical protein BIZ71_gp53 [Gordonia phage Hedwig]|uniref:Uncharacterized protein n=1 Tax=Gordonia phage Hedwig TaxID=1887648 RepID=A0A1C9EHT8_9CAUD|nr:hypothetical protein BIZ71_gp53 [Gordonia phage Hedwig]AON97346.1 hypothetical protein SEA_HEDWIG_53 [Gordonia phage Hedwig]
MSAPSDAQLEGLREANARLAHALDDCRRAAAGQPPRSRAEYEIANLGGGNIFNPAAWSDPSTFF